MSSNVIPTSIVNKAIAALDLWACHFKVIGTREETPRYAQLMQDDAGVFALRSTQKNLWYDLYLTDAEQEYLRYCIDGTRRWNAWRDIRNKYLRTYHPTIKL